MKEQILALYEISGLSVEEISSQLDNLDSAVIGSVLRQYSAMYRAAHPEADGMAQDFNDSEFKAARNTIAELAMSADNDFIKLHAAKFVFNERKGRNDPKAPQITLTNNNIVLISERAKRLRAARQVKPDAARTQQADTELPNGHVVEV